MGPDRMTSYRDTSQYSAGYTFAEGNANFSGAPFSKDVLEAMERGDLNEAMRLAKIDSPKKSGGNFLFFVKFGQAISYIFSFSPNLLKKGANGKKGDNFVTLIVASIIAAIAKASLKDAMKTITKMLQGSSHNFTKQIVKLFKQIQVQVMVPIGTVITQVGNAIVKIVTKMANATFTTTKETVEQLIKTVLTPVADFVAVKTEFVVEKVREFIQVIKNTAETAVKWVDTSTAPFREKVAEMTKTVVHNIEAFRQTLVEKTLVLYQPIERAFDDLLKRGHEFKNKSVEKISKVVEKTVEKFSVIKEKVEAVSQTVVQHLQTIPAIAAPFAFWLVKHAITPVGSIKENIIHFAKKGKKALDWMGDKAFAAGKFLGKGVEMLASQMMRSSDWFKKKVLPYLKRFLAWLKVKIISLARKMRVVTISIYKMQVKLLIALGKAIYQFVKSASEAFTRYIKALYPASYRVKNNSEL